MSTTPNAARPEIEGLLSRLKSRIQMYVVVEGVALVVCLLCFLFWLAYGLNEFWFWVTRLELPQWFRIGYSLVTVGLFVLTVLAFLVFRLARSFRSKALALVLERRFPELDDRLITAVEMSEVPPDYVTDLGQVMLDRTIGGVVQDARGIEVGDVFDRKPILRAVILGVVLFLVTGAFCFANPEGTRRFSDAYFAFKQEYWQRNTKLTVGVIAQPGDVRKDFRHPEGHELAGRPTNGEPGVYKHPKGSRLTLRIVVPAEGLNREGKPFEIPDRVWVRYRQDDGKSDRDEASKAADVEVLEKVAEIEAILAEDPENADEIREESQTLFDEAAAMDPLLLEQENARAVFTYERELVDESFDLWVTGGDYTNRQEYRVEVVEPPQIDSTVFDCDFPRYSGLNVLEEGRRRRVSGKSQALLEETRFVYEGATNKAIVGARVAFGDSELVFGPVLDEIGDPVPGRMHGELRQLDVDDPLAEWTETKLDEQVVKNFLMSDGMGCRLPFVVSRQLTDAAVERARQPFRDLGQPFVLAPGTKVRVYLSDADGIETVDPETLVVDGVEDTRPVFEELMTRDIGRRITPRAQIPFIGKVLDDHGLVKGRFEFRVERGRPKAEAGEPDEQPLELAWMVRKFENYPRPLSGLPESQDRLIAATATNNEGSWLFELQGDRERVAPVAFDVRSFLLSVKNEKADGKQTLKWKLPVGWTESWNEDRDKVRIKVGKTGLVVDARWLEGPPADFDKFLVAQVNRWRAKLSLLDFTEEDLKQAEQKNFVTVRGKNDEAITLTDFSTEYPRELPLGGREISTEGKGKEGDDRIAERFDVRPLELQPGNRLVVTVYAEDADDLNGPHSTRSDKFEFEIVGESDLQAMLYSRELDLLEQLKQVIKEVKESRDNLEDVQTAAGERDELLADGDVTEKDKPLRFVVDRSLPQVRISAGECRSIENSFREIAEELSNNDISERQIQVMRDDVITPLARANDDLFPRLDKALGAFKVGLEDETAVADDVAESVLASDELLSVLEKIAKDLEDRVSYLRFYRDLKGILTGQEGLKEKTQDESVRDALGDLKKLEGLGD